MIAARMWAPTASCSAIQAAVGCKASTASGCRFWAARVGAQPYGVGGDGPTGLSSPEIAKLRDQQAQRQPSLGTFPAPEVDERKLEPAAQTPNRRANGNEGTSRIVGRHGTCRPGIDDDIPVRGRVEVPKQRHNCVGGGTNLSNQVGFIGPSDAGQGVADVRRGLRHDVNSSLVGGIERDGIDIQPPCRRAAFQKPLRTRAAEAAAVELQAATPNADGSAGKPPMFATWPSPDWILSQGAHNIMGSAGFEG
jgi:hypothetical protein